MDVFDPRATVVPDDRQDGWAVRAVRSLKIVRFANGRQSGDWR